MQLTWLPIYVLKTLIALSAATLSQELFPRDDKITKDEASTYQTCIANFLGFNIQNKLIMQKKVTVTSQMNTCITGYDSQNTVIQVSS